MPGSDRPGLTLPELLADFEYVGVIREDLDADSERKQAAKNLFPKLYAVAFGWLLKSADRRLETNARQLPSCYVLVLFQSVSAFKAVFTTWEKTGYMNVRVAYMDYSALMPGESLSSLQLPARTAFDHILVVFRVNTGRDCSCCCVDALFLVPLGSTSQCHAQPSMPPVQDHDRLVADDVGWQRFQNGRCSHCDEVQGKLRACSGCLTHYYCSKDCQRAAWKQHKPLCRELHDRLERADTRGLRGPE